MDILTVSKATEFDICPDRYGEQQLTGVTLLTPDGSLNQPHDKS